MNKKQLTLLWALLAVTAYGETTVNLDKSTIYSTTGFETELRKTASNPTLVTSKEIEEKNYKTVEDILNDIPAVNVVRQGKDYIIDLRGQGDKAKQNVQILVDGVQMNSLDTSMAATPINTISPNDIERIEVLPGGGSVLYGSGTSGGVVNIITKKGNGTRVNAGYEYGSYANRKANIAVGESIGDFDVNLSYTNIDRNGYRDEDTSKSDNFMGNVRYKINDKQDVNFKYSRYEADETYPKLLTREQVEQDRQQSGLYSGRLGKEENTTDTKKDEFALTYNNKLSDNLDFSLTGFYQKTTMDVGTSSFAENIDMEMPSKIPGMPPMKFKGDNLVNLIGKFEDEKWGVKPKFRYSYGEGSSLIFGMDYINNKATRLSDNTIKNQFEMIPGRPTSMNIHSVTTNNLEKETISAYVMNNYVWKDFEFAQGLRYERANYKTERINNKIVTPPLGMPSKTTRESKSFSTDDNNIAYELSTNWLYSDTGKTYARYEKGFTSAPPSLLTNKLPNGEYVLNDLEAETYDNFEIGLSDYIGITSINASVFYTVTKDEITQDMAKGMPPAWIYNYNLGKTERFGFELKTEQYFDKLTLSQSYSYINTEIKDGKRDVRDDKTGNKKGEIDLSGNHIANVPEHKLNLGANYAITDKLSVGGDVVYMSGIYVNNQNQGGKVNSHTVVNVRARYAFENGLDVYAGVNNLFDKKYYEDIDYIDGDFQYDPAAERNYYVGFKYTF